MALLTCLAATAALAQAVEPPPDESVPRIRMQRFDVHFETDEGTEVHGVELWYTLDCGSTWHQAGLDPPRRTSPIPFAAPQEGLYGFLVIIVNQGGASSPRPVPGTEPQQWCFVDWTPPLVQLHVVQKDRAFAATRKIALQWTAYDAHLLDRPVDLYYMAQDQRLWIPIEQHLSNTGRYDWRVPESVGGRLILKMVVSDRGGHVVERFGEPLSVECAPAVSATRPAELPPELPATRVIANRPLAAGRVDILPAGSGGGDARLPRGEASSRVKPPWVADGPHAPPRRSPETPERTPVRGAHPTTVKAAVEWAQEAELASAVTTQPALVRPSAVDPTRAKKLHETGTWHRLRGELGIAELRFGEALEADPTCVEARQDLAGLLYVQGKYPDAVRQYKEVLRQTPDHRGAMKGLALALVACREYASAKEHLLRLTLLEADNADTWLNLGDACFLMGDRSGARDFWTKAAGVNPDAADVVDKARKRLAAYPALPLSSR